jgi:hypothetical protein
MISGNDSVLEADPNGSLSYVSGNHIHVTNASFNFNKNAPTDELRLAFSLISTNGASIDVPDNVKIMIEFSASDTSGVGEHAHFSVDIDDINFDGDAPIQKDFSANRYFVVSKQLQELSYTSGFNWEIVTVAKIYVSVTKNGTPSSSYYIGLDSMRLENLTTSNPLYGLTGYSVIKSDGALPIVKASNTSNFVEFRLAVGVE